MNILVAYIFFSSNILEMCKLSYFCFKCRLTYASIIQCDSGLVFSSLIMNRKPENTELDDGNGSITRNTGFLACKT